MLLLNFGRGGRKAMMDFWSRRKKSDDGSLVEEEEKCGRVRGSD